MLSSRCFSHLPSSPRRGEGSGWRSVWMKLLGQTVGWIDGCPDTIRPGRSGRKKRGSSSTRKRRTRRTRRRTRRTRRRTRRRRRRWRKKKKRKKGEGDITIAVQSMHSTSATFVPAPPPFIARNRSHVSQTCLSYFRLMIFIPLCFKSEIKRKTVRKTDRKREKERKREKKRERERVDSTMQAFSCCHTDQPLTLLLRPHVPTSFPTLLIISVPPSLSFFLSFSLSFFFTSFFKIFSRFFHDFFFFFLRSLVEFGNWTLPTIRSLALSETIDPSLFQSPLPHLPHIYIYTRTHTYIYIYICIENIYKANQHPTWIISIPDSYYYYVIIMPMLYLFHHYLAVIWAMTIWSLGVIQCRLLPWIMMIMIIMIISERWEADGRSPSAGMSGIAPSLRHPNGDQPDETSEINWRQTWKWGTLSGRWNEVVRGDVGGFKRTRNQSSYALVATANHHWIWIFRNSHTTRPEWRFGFEWWALMNEPIPES